MKKVLIGGIIIGSLATLVLLIKKYFKKVAKMVLSKEQEIFIDELHPSVQNTFENFISEVNKTGWKVIITSGYRSFSEQAKLKKENASNATAGLSEHNYGFAIDINLVNTSGDVLRKSTEKEKWVATGVPKIAKKLGLEWGGEKFAHYYDPVHFQKPVVTSKLLALAQKQFGNDVEKIQGNKVRLT